MRSPGEVVRRDRRGPRGRGRVLRILRIVLLALLVAFLVGFVIGTLIRRQLEEPVHYYGHGVDVRPPSIGAPA